MNKVEIFEKYLNAYGNKDLQTVVDMFAPDIKLRDWKISVEGKQAAQVETRKNFAAADKIEIEILTIFESKDSIAGELTITVDDTEVLYVIDVLSINSDRKISSIHAYLGRGD